MHLILCILLVSCLSQNYAQEVLEINKQIMDAGKVGLWPYHNSDGLYITADKVFIPRGNRLFIQNRGNTKPLETFYIKPYKEVPFRAYTIEVWKQKAFITGWYEGELLYQTYALDLLTGALSQPGRRNVNPGETIHLNDSLFVMAGNYRPSQLKISIKLLELNFAGRWPEMEALQKEYFADVLTYGLTFYDSNMQVVDTLDRVHRYGADIRYLERLHTRQMLDIDERQTLYQISNNNGYTLQVWRPPYLVAETITLKNKNYLPIPENLNEKTFERLGDTDKAYSSVSALYVKKDYTLCGFFNAPKERKPVIGPYFYDILTPEGRQVKSLVLNYPIIAEDQDSIIFFYVQHEVGWFEDDRHFLVGMTVEDLLAGQAEKKVIESAISRYMDKND